MGHFIPFPLGLLLTNIKSLCQHDLINSHLPHCAAIKTNLKLKNYYVRFKIHPQNRLALGLIASPCYV